jgi:hypothetical protein
MVSKNRTLYMVAKWTVVFLIEAPIPNPQFPIPKIQEFISTYASLIASVAFPDSSIAPRPPSASCELDRSFLLRCIRSYVACRATN